MAERWRQHQARAATAARQGDREAAARERAKADEERKVAKIRDAVIAAGDLSTESRKRILRLMGGDAR